MSQYRRFVAYIYEYRKGKKGVNCGFLKVEAKQEQCVIEVHLQSPGLAPGLQCRIYGFIRKDGLMESLLLGECRSKEGKAECVLETKTSDLAGSSIALSRLGGMLILTEGDGFYGTQWDNQPIKPENFQERRKAGLQETDEAEELEEKERAQKEPEPDQTQKSKDKTEEKPEEKEKAKIHEEQKKTENQGSEEPAEAAEPIVQEENTGEPELQASSLTMEAKALEQETKEKALNQETAGKPTDFQPFDDGEIIDCIRIEPKDFQRFQRRDWGLKNNRFLLYGYYNFGYLLLGRRRDNGCYVIGVPGLYDQQERFMANMFGFPYFKESKAVELPQGRGGYWYRLIDPPNLN